MRRALLSLAKLAASAGLLAYLLAEVQRSDPQIWVRLRGAGVYWPTLVLGLSCLLGSLVTGVLRWHVVLRAFGVVSPLRWLFRCGLFGFALDFAALGTAGGDLVKGLLLARRVGGRRALVLVSVFLDRIIGLHAMLTLVTIVLLVTDALQPQLSVLRSALIAAGLGINAVLAVFWLVPAVWRFAERHSRSVARYGRPLVEVVGALRNIRERPQVLLRAELVNFLALAFLVTGCHLVAISLPGEMPTFGEQWQVVPIAMLSAILPLPAGSLGALDYAMSVLYQQVSAGRVPLGQGVVVVMVSRTVSVAVSVFAVVLYATTNEPARRVGE